MTTLFCFWSNDDSSNHCQMTLLDKEYRNQNKNLFETCFLQQFTFFYLQSICSIIYIFFVVVVAGFKDANKIKIICFIIKIIMLIFLVDYQNPPILSYPILSGCSRLTEMVIENQKRLLFRKNTKKENNCLKFFVKKKKSI